MKIPRISGLETVRRLKKFGFIVTRQKGSHVRMEKVTANETTKITVPMHSELKAGTLLHILKDAGLTKEEFEEL